MKRYLLYFNIIHLLNDGYKGGFVLLLPFIAKDFNLNLGSVGFLATIVNVSTTILAIPTGYLSGRFGGIRILTLSLFVYAIGFIVTGLSHSPLFLPFTFFLTSLGFGAFHTIGFALIAKFTSPEKRGKVMGEFSVSGEVGKVGFSTAITALAGWVGWHIGSIIFGVFALLVGCVSFLFSFTKYEEEKSKQLIQKNPSRFRDIAKDKHFLAVNLAGVFDTFASGSLYIFIPFLLIQRHVPLAWLGFFTALFFVGSIVGKMLLGNLIDTYGNEKVFILSEIGMALFILILSNISYIPGIVVAATILGIFTKGTAPIINTMVSDTLEKHGNFEKGFALNNLTLSAANTLAPIALGILADKLGIISAFNISALFAVLAIIPALGARWIRKQSAEEKIILQEVE